MKKHFIACSILCSIVLTTNNLKAQQYYNTILANKASVFTNAVESGCWTPTQGYVDANAAMLGRVEIRQQAYQQTEGFRKLSTVDMRLKCNPNLQSDINNFDENNFNPLKYFLDFTIGKTTTYRVDNTPYIIVIHP